MNILVTGGAGFIGSHLVRLLIEHGHHIVNFDVLKYSGNLENLREVTDHSRYTFVHGDICHRKEVADLFASQPFDAVINCAAETHVDRSILEPGGFAMTDVVGTATLLEEAKNAKVPRFLQVSTDEVYGSVESGSSAEDDALDPRSPYSASKAGADLLVRSYWSTYRFPILITRGSNTYGPNQYPEKFIPLFVTNALEEQPMPLYGDGRYRRDWIYVLDHCLGIEAVLRHGEPGHVYNVGGGNERENIAIAEAILAHLGKPSSLIQYVQDRPGHDRRYAVNCSRLRSLGWKPTVPFEEGLRQTVDWYKDNQTWWRTIKSGEFKTYYQQAYGQRLGARG